MIKKLLIGYAAGFVASLLGFALTVLSRGWLGAVRDFGLIYLGALGAALMALWVAYHHQRQQNHHDRTDHH